MNAQGLVINIVRNARGLVANIARNTPNGFTPRIKDVIVQTLFYRRQQIRGVGKEGEEVSETKVHIRSRNKWKHSFWFFIT